MPTRLMRSNLPWARGRSSWSASWAAANRPLAAGSPPGSGMPFVDADEEIEKAAGKSIEDIFAEHGEPYFREGRAQGARPPAALGPAGLGDGRRCVHECRDARGHRSKRHLDLAQGRSGAARAPRRQAQQSSAAQDRRPGSGAAGPHGRPLSGLCAGRHHRGKPRRAARGRSSPIYWSAWREKLQVASPPEGPQ